MPAARIAPLPSSNLAREDGSREEQLQRSCPKLELPKVGIHDSSTESIMKESSMHQSKEFVRFDPHCQIHRVEANPPDSWWTKAEIRDCRRADQLSSNKKKIQIYLRTSTSIYRQVCGQERIEYDSLVPIQEGLDLGFRGIERWCSVSGNERQENSREIVRLIVMALKDSQAPRTPEELRELSCSLTENSRELAEVLGQLDALAARP